MRLPGKTSNLIEPYKINTGSFTVGLYEGINVATNNGLVVNFKVFNYIFKKFNIVTTKFANNSGI